MRLLLTIAAGLFLSKIAVGAPTMVQSAIEPLNGSWRLQIISESPQTLPEILFTGTFATPNQAQEYAARQFGVNNILKSTAVPRQGSVFKTEDPKGFLWRPTEKWSWDWEVKYAQWIETELDKDFFVRHQVATDCADLAIATRWIFARIHSLPAANTIGALGTLFTNESMKRAWADLPTDNVWHKDARFLAALDYLLDLAGTPTIYGDSYPVAVNGDGLLPGAFALHFGDSVNHTQLVYKTFPNDSSRLPVYLAESTTPRVVRELNIYGYSPYKPELDIKKSSFRRHLWPVKTWRGWRMTRAEEMPFYSLEQFSPDFLNGYDSLLIAVLSRINPHFEIYLPVSEGVANIAIALQQRIQIVEEGYQFCLVNDCQVGSPGYEAWSTPSRDERIMNQFNEVIAYVDYLGRAEVRGGWDVWSREMESKKIEVCGHVYNLTTMMYLWRYSEVSSDPKAAIEERWGCAYLANYNDP